MRLALAAGLLIAIAGPAGAVETDDWYLASILLTGRVIISQKPITNDTFQMMLKEAREISAGANCVEIPRTWRGPRGVLRNFT